MQIHWIYKHCFETTIISPIPCSKMFDGIFFVRSIYVKKTITSHLQITMQCPLVCATCIFGERGWNFVNDIRMPLAPHHSSIITIIAFNGRLKHIGVWDQQFLFHIRCDNLFHYIVFYEFPSFMIFLSWTFFKKILDWCI